VERNASDFLSMLPKDVLPPEIDEVGTHVAFSWIKDHVFLDVLVYSDRTADFSGKTFKEGFESDSIAGFVYIGEEVEQKIEEWLHRYFKTC